MRSAEASIAMSASKVEVADRRKVVVAMPAYNAGRALRMTDAELPQEWIGAEPWNAVAPLGVVVVAPVPELTRCYRELSTPVRSGV